MLVACRTRCQIRMIHFKFLFEKENQRLTNESYQAQLKELIFESKSKCKTVIRVQLINYLWRQEGIRSRVTSDSKMDGMSLTLYNLLLCFCILYNKSKKEIKPVLINRKNKE